MKRTPFITGDLDYDAIKKLIHLREEDSQMTVILQGLGGKVELIPIFVEIANRSPQLDFVCFGEMRSSGAFIAASLNKFKLSPGASLNWHAFGTTENGPHSPDAPLFKWCFETASRLVRSENPLVLKKLKELCSTGSFKFKKWNPPYIEFLTDAVNIKS